MFSLILWINKCGKKKLNERKILLKINFAFAKHFKRVIDDCHRAKSCLSEKSQFIIELLAFLLRASAQSENLIVNN